jgi:hypothetical protein
MFLRSFQEDLEIPGYQRKEIDRASQIEEDAEIDRKTVAQKACQRQKNEISKALASSQKFEKLRSQAIGLRTTKTSQKPKI